jgi:hypothetical protein
MQFPPTMTSCGAECAHAETSGRSRRLESHYAHIAVRIAVLATCGIAMTGCAHVRATESWPELGQRLSPGKSVTVTTTSGHEVAGRIAAISGDSLQLTVNGATQQFGSADLREVRRNGDSLWNGLAIGAAIGATMVALPDSRYYNCGATALCTDRQIPERLTFFAGVTVAGIIIDALHRDRTLLYRSPATPVGKGVRHPQTKAACTADC